MMDEAVRAAAYWAQAGDLDRAFAMLERATALGNDRLTMYEASGLYAGA